MYFNIHVINIIFFMEQGVMHIMIMLYQWEGSGKVWGFNIFVSDFCQIPLPWANVSKCHTFMALHFIQVCFKTTPLGQ